MLGILCSIIAGMAMSFQGVMNTRLSEKIGLYESNAFVQGTAFLLSLLAVWILGKGNFGSILQVDNKLYLFGGVLGLVITITVMLGIKGLSPTVSISISLSSQLLVAALIDAFGWLGTEKTPFDWSKYVGMGLMIAGVLLFKMKQNG
jgi:transporter family-2 protein